MNYFNMGVRNLLRNRRRSLASMLGVAFGFAAVALFAGYTHNVYEGLSRSAIRGELLGHVTISRSGLQADGRLNPKQYLFSRQDVERITAILQRYPHTQLVTPRLTINGLISNGKASTIFVAEGVVPADGRELQRASLRKSLSQLDDLSPTGIVVAEGLSGILRLNRGDSAAMLVSTVDGQANALDVDIADVFNTGNAGTNDKLAFVPLALAQALYDVEGADRLIVLLDVKERTGEAQAVFRSQLSDAGFDVDVQNWEALSAYYRQVKSLLDMIFSFIFSIVFTVVMMSLINSMSMTVVERTREIGTLRALGLRRSGVIRLFAVESLLLVFFGCMTGLVLTAIVIVSVNGAGISYTPPNSSNVVPLMVNVDAPRTLLCFLMLCIAGVLASLSPARRAARQLIVESLGHA